MKDYKYEKMQFSSNFANFEKIKILSFRQLIDTKIPCTNNINTIIMIVFIANLRLMIKRIFKFHLLLR